MSAIAVSLLAHGLIVAAAIWSLTAPSLKLKTGSSSPEGGAVTVTLVAATAAAGPEQPTPSTDLQARAQMDALFQKFRSADPPASAPQRASAPSNVDQLFKEISDEQSKANAGHPTNAAPDRSDPDGDDLGARIRPCWKPISRDVVTMEVSIDSEGRLAGPPAMVLAPGLKPGPELLRAESMAVQAAVRCAPYRAEAPLRGARRFKVVLATR